MDRRNDGVLATMPPRWVFALLNPMTKLLLGAGIPLAYNGLITIRGRMSGHYDERRDSVALMECVQTSSQI